MMSNNLTPSRGVPSFCEYHCGMVDRDQCDNKMAGLKTRLETRLDQVKPKTSDPGTWIRWAAGVVLVVLGSWWGLSTMFSERPTRSEVKEEITERKPHPETRAIVDGNTTIIRQQQRQLDRIEVGVDAIKTTLKDR